jgi:hypothetical protein
MRGVNGIRRFWARLGIAFVAGVTLLACDTPDSGAAPASPITAVQAVGNHFVDGSGRSLRLLGFNVAGAEYSCIARWRLHADLDELRPAVRRGGHERAHRRRPWHRRPDRCAGRRHWLDGHGASYTPWSWNPWGDCWSLAAGWGGEPTRVWGAEVRRRLAAG